MRQKIGAGWVVVLVLFGAIALASALPREPSPLPFGVQIPMGSHLPVAAPACLDAPDSAC